MTASAPLYRNAGIAVVNPSFATAQVSLKLTGLDGTVRTSLVTIGPNSRLTQFVTRLFPEPVPPNFSGLLELSSTSRVALAALRMTVNERKEMIYSALPLADLANPPKGEQFLPYFVNGGGYKTEPMINNTSSQNASVSLTLLDGQGSPVDARLFK